MISTYKVLVGKSQQKRPFERCRDTWRESVMAFKETEIGWRLGSFGLGQEPLAGFCEDCNRPISAHFLEYLIF
jgi:hypothetical protein